MNNLMVIYDCPKCGKILEDEVVHGEDIDSDNDETYTYSVCENCGATVTPRMQDGLQCFEEVSDERVWWAREKNQFENDDDDDDDY